jgi:hypothetical protein
MGKRADASPFNDRGKKPRQARVAIRTLMCILKLMDEVHLFGYTNIAPVGGSKADCVTPGVTIMVYFSGRNEVTPL